MTDRMLVVLLCVGVEVTKFRCPRTGRAKNVRICPTRGEEGGQRLRIFL